MKFNKEDKKIIDFANYLNMQIREMLFQDKISSNMITGILQQQIYNIHRTMEKHPELVTEITEKYFPAETETQGVQK